MMHRSQFIAYLQSFAGEQLFGVERNDEGGRCALGVLEDFIARHPESSDETWPRRWLIQVNDSGVSFQEIAGRLSEVWGVIPDYNPEADVASP